MYYKTTPLATFSADYHEEEMQQDSDFNQYITKQCPVTLAGIFSDYAQNSNHEVNVVSPKFEKG